MSGIEGARVVDRRGRPLRDLRISVIDRCNFRCTYCMPAEVFGPGYPFLPPSALLSFSELTRLVRAFVALGVEKVRITGGEPLLRVGLERWIEDLAALPEIRDIALTTNGVLLAKKARALKAAGLRRVNVSLDSLDPVTFGRMNGRGTAPDVVLRGIEAAIEAGLQVKVNMVVKRGENERDILPMARYFKALGVTLRFIEFMDVGTANGWEMRHVVPSREILERIHAEMPLEPLEPAYYGEVAKRYRYKDGSAEVGFISSVTQAFCGTCTRARLSADGKLYTCLFAADGFDLRRLLREGADDETLRAAIRSVWAGRTDRYSELRLQATEAAQKAGAVRKKIEMFYIGG
ncbi:MAG: GTP 3',8-cyclase MoaA [Hydrogenibacillus schlegelii]|nr:GTP 3',8-cyclase MoaA [Hydrogenibacillus schlegelii]